MNLFKNVFVQSLGVGALIYIILIGLDWAMTFFLATLETFSQWYRFHASPYAFQVALGVSVIYVVVMAVFSSREG